jgi:hypothetical protein
MGASPLVEQLTLLRPGECSTYPAQVHRNVNTIAWRRTLLFSCVSIRLPATEVNVTLIRTAAALLIVLIAGSCSTATECPTGSSPANGLCHIDDPSREADFVLPQPLDIETNDPADTTADSLPDLSTDGTPPDLNGDDAVATPTDTQMKETLDEKSNSD